jgi:hypothetical protein
VGVVNNEVLEAWYQKISVEFVETLTVTLRELYGDKYRGFEIRNFYTLILLAT